MIAAVLLSGLCIVATEKAIEPAGEEKALHWGPGVQDLWRGRRWRRFSRTQISLDYFWTDGQCLKLLRYKCAMVSPQWRWKIADVTCCLLLCWRHVPWLIYHCHLFLCVCVLGVAWCRGSRCGEDYGQAHGKETGKSWVSRLTFSLDLYLCPKTHREPKNCRSNQT